MLFKLDMATQNSYFSSRCRVVRLKDRSLNFYCSICQGFQRLITKICDKLKCLNRHRSESIRVTSLFFCQNDVLIGGSFWQKDSLVTLILFDLSVSIIKNIGFLTHETYTLKCRRNDFMFLSFDRKKEDVLGIHFLCSKVDVF